MSSLKPHLINKDFLVTTENIILETTYISSSPLYMMTFLSPNLPDSHLYKMGNIIYVFNGVKRERREEKEGRDEGRWGGERKKGEGRGLKGRGGNM